MGVRTGEYWVPVPRKVQRERTRRLEGDRLPKKGVLFGRVQGFSFTVGRRGSFTVEEESIDPRSFTTSR